MLANRSLKIAFDVRELSGQPAGVGRVISSLINAIQEIAPGINLVLIGDSPAAPAAVPGEYIGIMSSGLDWHFKCAKLLKNNPQWKAYVSIRSPLVPIMVPNRSVYFVNDLISFIYPEYFTLKTRVMNRLFVKPALSRVNRIVAISRSTAQDIERIRPGAGKRTTVVYLAADKVFSSGPPDPVVLRRLGLTNKYIMTVGTIEPRKNHLSLIRAYQALPDKLRSDYRLVIVGKKGWKCEQIIQTINRMEAGGHLKYLEYIDDSTLAQVYRGSSLFVYPSFYEGFGLPVLEAMKCGVPVITSNVSSLPEVGGNAAFYVNPRDPGQLTQSIERILTNNNHARIKSNRGIKQASKFSWHNSARTFLKIINDMDIRPDFISE